MHVHWLSLHQVCWWMPHKITALPSTRAQWAWGLVPSAWLWSACGIAACAKDRAKTKRMARARRKRGDTLRTMNWQTSWRWIWSRRTVLWDELWIRASLYYEQDVISWLRTRISTKQIHIQYLQVQMHSERLQCHCCYCLSISGVTFLQASSPLLPGTYAVSETSCWTHGVTVSSLTTRRKSSFPAVFV